MTAPRSLRGWLVSRLLALQAAALILFVLVIFATLWAAGYLVTTEPEDAAIDVVAHAVKRTGSGPLAIQPTPDWVRLQEANPNLWFSIRDDGGQNLTHGTIPPEFAHVGPALDGIGQARLGWQIGDPPRPTARMKRVDSPAGPLQILIGATNPMPLNDMLRAVLMLFLTVILPTFALMALTTLTTTPIVVRRALVGLNSVSDHAQRIGANDRGARLPLANVPREVVPLVQAVNAALERLDDGYERRQRFLTDAAHELRTPIAILMTRLETLPGSPQKVRLLSDAARLSNLAEQLLDLQRVDRHLTFAPVDLVALGRRVTADLAPLAISAGHDLSFESDAVSDFVTADESSLERAVVNVVQNAIEHTGKPGTIVVRAGGGCLEVSDDGAGIPEAQRERIFEPFQRLRPRNRGAGLGLHLVSEIMNLHGGTVEIDDAPWGGTRFRLVLPPMSRA